jgi:hypothetical protein
LPTSHEILRDPSETLDGEGRDRLTLDLGDILAPDDLTSADGLSVDAENPHG